ncbi:MAG: YvrJ family protein [Synergistaceae bacterium]|nr:YvrJ family protein [Synergistaceae bacterium]
MEAFIESTLQSSFSIIVSGFLLLRMEGELRALRQAIDRLRYCQICRYAPLVGPETVLGASENKEVAL